MKNKIHTRESHYINPHRHRISIIVFIISCFHYLLKNARIDFFWEFDFHENTTHVLPDIPEIYDPVSNTTMRKSIRIFMVQCKEKDNIPVFNFPTTVYHCNEENNFCLEAMPMLDFLYDWYDKMEEEIVIFMHPHISSWHQSNITMSVEELINTDYFWSVNYGGFRETTWKACCDNMQYAEFMMHAFNGTSMPRVWERWGVYPCCSTFFVRWSSVKRRKRWEYKLIKENIINFMKQITDHSWHCSRAMEYIWHQLLGGENVVPLPFKKEALRWMILKEEGSGCTWNRTDIGDHVKI